MPGLTHIQHPRNFAWFHCNAALSSVLGDIVAGGLGALGSAGSQPRRSPNLNRLSVTGHGGSPGSPMAGAARSMTALPLPASSRCWSPGKWPPTVPKGGEGCKHETALTVYCSADAHSSVSKGALLAGYGADNLRLVPVRRPAAKWTSPPSHP